MHGNDYRAALPRPNELKCLRAIDDGDWWKADDVSHRSGVKLTHMYTYLGRMCKCGYVESAGPHLDRWYRITKRGRQALGLAEKVERL